MGDSAITAVGVGTSVISGVMAYNQAKEDAELANAMKAINNQQVYQSMLSTYQSLEIQADQVDEAYVANSIDQQKAEARARGSAEAAQGASGTGGSGLDMQLQEASVEGSMNTARMRMNRERQMDSIQSQGDDAVNLANQRLDRMPKQQAPSLIATGLNIGMSGFINTVALKQTANSWDNVFGSSDTLGFSTESLVDSNVNATGSQTA